MHRLQRSEIWGGNEETDSQISTSTLSANLYSSSSDGGKGGDIYFFTLCPGALLTRIALADVTGHGKKVRQISQWMHDTLKSKIGLPEGNDVLMELNHSARTQGYRAVTTAAVVAFYKETSALDFSYAGHPPVFLHRTGDNSWQKVIFQSPTQGGNTPLGVLDPVTYDQEAVPLKSGDKIFLYTDGVLETPDPQGNLFGYDGLTAVLDEYKNQRPAELKKAVLEALTRHAKGAFVHDDLTLIAAQIN